MKTIEIEQKNVDAAISIADDSTKKVLSVLFGKETAKQTPSLDDYKTIQGYEDACIALGINPIDENYLKTDADIPNHIISLMKLETISRALWGRNFQPTPDANESKIYYCPWFVLYTKREIENLDDDDRGALLSADAADSAFAAFGDIGTSYRSLYPAASVGFRLCQETEEKAAYFGKQFIKLWAEYTVFNFTTGDHLK